MPRCETCNGFVSAEFVRVFGTNDGRVYGCPDCESAREIFRGSTASREP